MKNIFLIILFLGIFQINGNSIELSDSLQVSILTEAPGTELYSVFGHTGIRIKDLAKGYDIVFNYGMFDFNTSFFYFKFALGRLDYTLAVESFDGFVAEAKDENRQLTEQILNLTKRQKLDLTAFLIKNYEPQNRYYRYKFFTNNCSTRVRDAIVDATDDPYLLKKSEVCSQITFQKLYTDKLESMPWCKFGIGFLLGKLTQKKAGYDAMFLPEILQKSIAKAQLNGHPLVSSENIIVNPTLNEDKQFWFSPFLLSLIMLVLAISAQIFPKCTKIFDITFFLLFGLFGMFITFLSIVSKHAELHYNFVILFILPTNIIIPFIRNSLVKKYFCLSSLLIVIFSLILIPLIPQTFSIEFIILALAIAIRLYFNFKTNI